MALAPLLWIIKHSILISTFAFRVNVCSSVALAIEIISTAFPLLLSRSAFWLGMSIFAFVVLLGNIIGQIVLTVQDTPFARDILAILGFSL